MHATVFSAIVVNNLIAMTWLQRPDESYWSGTPFRVVSVFRS